MKKIAVAGATGRLGRHVVDLLGEHEIVAVSIIGCDRFSAGYNVAKVAHEREMRSGPVTARILRAARSTSSWSSS